jgi:hypothetical protein
MDAECLRWIAGHSLAQCCGCCAFHRYREPSSRGWAPAPAPAPDGSNTQAGPDSPSTSPSTGPMVPVVIGNTQWMTEHGVPLEPATLGEVARLEEGGCTVVVAAVAGQAVAVIAIADALKPESRRVVAALHRMGMRVWMITGDSRYGRAGQGGRGEVMLPTGCRRGELHRCCDGLPATASAAADRFLWSMVFCPGPAFATSGLSESFSSPCHGKGLFCVFVVCCGTGGSP